MRFSTLFLSISTLLGNEFVFAEDIIPVKESSLPSVCENSEDCRSDKQETCRGSQRLKPHQQGLWEEGFPEQTTNLQVPLCEGEISIASNGEICIDGRVSYSQINEFIQKDSSFTEKNSVYTPSADSISVTGHLTTGSGNFLHGNKAIPVYDMVNSYIVNGTNYTSDETMIDKLLAASSGTIDGVCFDPSFVQPESFYSLSYKFYGPSSVNIEAFNSSNLIFGSSVGVVLETHTAMDSTPGFLVRFFSRLRIQTFFLFSSFPTPQFLYDLFPIFSLTGYLRRIIVGQARLSTVEYPNPLVAPSASVENIQMDILWSDLLSLVENGIYSQFPSKMGSIIKKITPKEGSLGCWKADVASVDLQMPLGYGQDLDDFVNDVLYPKLLELNSAAKVSFSFGKRLPQGSPALKNALDTFGSCGASLSLTVENCYHPMCNREINATSFEYPEKYYAAADRRLR